jgi:hypothetical protein
MRKEIGKYENAGQAIGKEVDVKNTACCTTQPTPTSETEKDRDHQERQVTNPKVCLWCGTELVRGEQEPEHNWEKREHCNKSHAALHSNEKRSRRKK